MEFSPENPYPLVSNYTYEQAKAHARQVDTWLGFQFEQCEQEAAKKWPSYLSLSEQNLWAGLDVQSLQTTYLEFRTMLAALPLQDGNLIVDLGCAYARLAHVLKKHYPTCRYLGYELMEERLTEAQRILGTSATLQLEKMDLSIESPISAEFYFLYDYGSKQAIAKTLEDLKEIGRNKKIHVIARGRASRSLIHQHHLWLSEVEEPLHFETFSIYKN